MPRKIKQPYQIGLFYLVARSKACREMRVSAFFAVAGPGLEPGIFRL